MSQAVVNATKTTRPTKTGLQRTWYVLDAAKEPLGRLATKAANLLTGKNRADYAGDVDMGGIVVVINAKSLVMTGQKLLKKNYFWHSGRIGGIKVRNIADQMVKDPKVPVYRAVRGMLPKNRHQDERLHNRLYIFPENHDLTVTLVAAN
jgi:large subunit ribosomal protein L13